MRRTQQVILAGSLALAMGIGLAGAGISVAEAPPISASAAFAVTEKTLAGDLAYSRDEERMARDLYLLFGQTYGAAIFDRIAASEQQHFDAVGSLLTSSAIGDPAAGQPVGTYADPAVQRLYDQWKAEGLTSLEDAYAVGVALEQTDIADLEKISARQTDADVKRVFSHLLTSSRHHLAAFTDLADGGTAGAPCDGSQTGHGMGDGAGMGRMGRSDS